VLGREKTPQTPPADEQPKAGKGRPTPSRKESEAANRRPLVPTDRKVAGKDARSAARTQRDREYQAMQKGDIAHMPAQHRGPVRTYVRDWVDARRSLGEYFLPVVLGLFVLAAVLTGPLAKQGANGALAVFVLYILVYVYLVASVIDTFLIWRKVRAQLAAKFGADTARSRGLAMYAISRIFMFRRIRMPKARIKHGEYPS
jgi:hypothetical protein